jgi:hypothetical protein
LRENDTASLLAGQDKENSQGEPDTQKVHDNHFSENGVDAIGINDFRSGNADLQEGHYLLE